MTLSTHLINRQLAYSIKESGENIKGNLSRLRNPSSGPFPCASRGKGRVFFKGFGSHRSPNPWIVNPTPGLITP